MEKPSFKLVGSPCGQHGQYTFYKALRISGEAERIIAIGDFFFVRIWQDSELVSIGELQLLWTDRVSDQTLVSLRLYFLPENTPDGRNMHGEDEVLALNEKVVVRAEDLLSWVCTGATWDCGLRAVWRGACAPSNSDVRSAPLHHTKLDFSDVDKEKGAIASDADTPGVVVFSYPRYCRYRALVSRLEGIEAAWLRDSLVAALGGYAASTNNTRILYCKDTFEYPELEGHEFVCNHLAPRLKGRPRGRRRRAQRSRSPSRSSRSSESDAPPPLPREPKNPRRLSLRNADRQSDEEDQVKEQTAEDKTFLQQLRQFYRDSNEPFKMAHSLKDLSLRALYEGVASRGGYEAVCRLKLWRVIHADRPARVRSHYERFLLPFENHERRNGSKYFQKPNGKLDPDPKPIDTIDVTDSPLREIPKYEHFPKEEKLEKIDPLEKRLRTPSPKLEEKEIKEEFNTTSKPAAELNQEFLDSLPNVEKPIKITVKPVEKLIEEKNDNNVIKLFEENSALITELSVKYNVKDSNVIEELGKKQLSESSSVFLGELAQRLNLDTPVPSSQPLPLTSLTTLSEKYVSNGHNGTNEQKSVHTRPAPAPVGRSSLRAVRVKPTRPSHAPNNTPPIPPLRPDSASSSPPTSQPSATPTPTPTPTPTITNFGIYHPPASTASHSDDEIVEVPYKPKTPEIIDLDEYPESPQGIKKKKLDILKERGLEVTAIAPTWGTPPLTPLLNPPMILNPAMQHQIMTQASLFQMYNIIPQNYANGIQPPKVIQATCIYGSSGPEKTVYGNPKDPFMPPPHILHGTPMKPQRVVTSQEQPRQDILDLTCKTSTMPSQKPAVEIVRIPTASPSKTAQNLSKSYTLIDGKAVVGSNLEITLVNPKITPPKNRPVQKRSSNGKFMSTKTPTPPKDYTKPYSSPSSVNMTMKKTPLNVPNYQIRDDLSPTSSTGSRDSQTNLNSALYKGQNLTQMMEQKSPNFAQYSDRKTPNSTQFMEQKASNLTQIMDMHKSHNLAQLMDQKPPNLTQIMDMQKSQNLAQIMDMQKSQNFAQIMDMQKSQNLAQIMDMQKSQNMAQIMDLQKSQNLAQLMEMQKNQNMGQIMDKPPMASFMDPAYLNAFYSSFGQMDQRQLAMYRDFMAFRGYSSLLGVATPTTKN